MLIDTVKNQITAGEVKHDITESMLELATDVCRDINQAAGQFSAMQKVVLQAAADHHLEICGGGTHPFQKWQRQEVCDNERYQRTLENFGYLIQQATVFGQHVHVGCASGDDAIYCCTACHGLCRTLSPFPPRRHICRERIRVLPPHDRIFFPPFPIMAQCRGSVTGNNLKPCFAA
ncbi:carboxylate-amine ligase [Escherichia coli]|uniref:Carboxylate-amine ligase n=1 Tax=Escherichia coli TaxID=562 RepID=A0A376W0Z1_ECOLX|nr:carboxylate-amine ligase [Escherichia coli]